MHVTYSEAKSSFSDRNRDVLMNVQSLHKWWSSLKSVVFGWSSSLPPLVSLVSCSGLPARSHFYHIAPDSHCALVVALSEKGSIIQYDYRK